MGFCFEDTIPAYSNKQKSRKNSRNISKTFPAQLCNLRGAPVCNLRNLCFLCWFCFGVASLREKIFSFFVVSVAPPLEAMNQSFRRPSNSNSKVKTPKAHQSTCEVIDHSGVFRRPPSLLSPTTGAGLKKPGRLFSGASFGGGLGGPKFRLYFSF